MKLTIEFDLEEEVTPGIFARRVASTLAQCSVLRKGESVAVKVAPGTFVRYEFDGDFHTAEMLPGVTAYHVPSIASTIERRPR